jgi:acetyl-CoA carboxylase carboxyl transferase subunit beta
MIAMAKGKKAGWDGFSLKPRKEMPEGLWLSCPGCKNMLYKKTVDENLSVCPECRYHFRIDGPTRVKQLVDEGSFEELAQDLASSDPLAFVWGDQQYKKRIKADPTQTAHMRRCSWAKHSFAAAA